VTSIRPARASDVPGILQFVRDLAAYEREPDAVLATEEDLTAALFPAGGEPLAHALVAEADGALAGMAIWYVAFSTWEGRHGIFLEDLYVRPEHRTAGIGRLLLAQLAAEAVRRGYPRVEWSVLDWNASARGFYERLGGRAMTSWVPYRLAGPALHALAGDMERIDAAET
jgi:GNAT superfamily N-acetyltransferase